MRFVERKNFFVSNCDSAKAAIAQEANEKNKTKKEGKENRNGIESEMITKNWVGRL